MIPALTPRDIDFSDVSSKTLHVIVLRSIVRPSHVHLLGGFIGLLTSSLPPALAIDSHPDLIAASRNGLRATDLWAAAVGGRLGNHNAAPH